MIEIQLFLESHNTALRFRSVKHVVISAVRSSGIDLCLGTLKCKRVQCSSVYMSASIISVPPEYLFLFRNNCVQSTDLIFDIVNALFQYE